MMFSCSRVATDIQLIARPISDDVLKIALTKVDSPIAKLFSSESCACPQTDNKSKYDPWGSHFKLQSKRCSHYATARYYRNHRPTPPCPEQVPLLECEKLNSPSRHLAVAPSGVPPEALCAGACTLSPFAFV